MNKAFFLIFTTLIITTQVKASNGVQECAADISKAEISQITEKLIHQHFPKLVEHNNKGFIHIKFFQSNEYYLKTMFKLTHFAKRKNQRVLFLNINYSLLNCPPRAQALEAILVHELFHLQDYLTSTSLGLVKLGSKYLTRKSIARYERHTDLRAMKLNYSKGLIGYREWIYPKLSKRKLKKKKIIYYTPQEIEDWLSNSVPQESSAGLRYRDLNKAFNF